MNSESRANASSTKVCDTMAGLNCRERIIGYGDVVESSSAEKRAFSSIGFSDYADLHGDHEGLSRSDSSNPDSGALGAVANVE